ncbi:DUF4012 domain-containing protein [Candidatus Uhrbacteria bacterium]|nr:DUF4012 domain-containing protein [Candidatus Uhrbacteria bacterium]
MSHSEQFFQSRRRRRFKIVALAIAVVVCIVSVVIVAGLALFSQARAFERSVRDVQSELIHRDFDEAGASLADARTNLARLKRVTNAARPLQIIPGVSQQYSAAQTLFEDTEALLDVVGVFVSIGIRTEEELRVVGGFSSVMDAGTFSDLQPDERRALVKTLERAVPDLEEALARLNTEESALVALEDTALLPGLRMVQKDLLKHVQSIQSSMRLIVPWLHVLPTVGGFDRPQTYLLLMQNTGELRPTGGFWGTYGVMTVQNGEITSLDTDDIYAVDVLSIGKIHTAPPEPLKRYLGVDTWYLRDINWSPDVPTSVQDGFAAYARQIAFAPSPENTGTIPAHVFDGAILVTPSVAERLLEVLGPERVGDLLFSKDAFFETLEHAVEVGFYDRGVTREDRKDVIGNLLEQLLTRVLEADRETLQEISEVAMASLNNQDIVLYHTDANVERVFENNNWAGDVRVNAAHDYVMVVDANLAALKTDASLARAYRYSIARQMDGRYLASLRVDYDHRGSFDYKTTRYRTFTRVYVPAGSELVRVDGALKDDRLKNPSAEAGDVTVTSEFGATVFGAFTSVEPGASGSLTFHYYVPERVVRQIDSGAYTLDVQRQIGVGDVPLTLELDFDRELSAAEPGEERAYWHDDRYSYSTRLTPFQTFRIWLTP